MRKFIRMSGLVAALLGSAAAVSAATPGEFYLGLLRRGTASYEASRHEDAVKQLKIAAFGLVDAVDHYQFAQVYLTLTYDKLQDSDRAREAAHRVYLAERVDRKYAGLPLPPAVRTAFEALAGKLMSPSESAVLLRGAELPPAATPSQRVTTIPAQTPPSTPRRTTPAAAPQTKPAVSQPPAQPVSQPTQPRNTTIPAPKTTTPEKAAPQTAPQTITPVPQPEKPKTVTPAPQTTKPQTATATPTQAAKPQQTATTAPQTTTKPISTEADGRGGPIEPARPATPPPAPTPRALSASEVATRLATAERSLIAGNLNEARRVYRELAGATGLDHESMIRVAEGLYRARDFSAALSAFNRVGTLRRGEEPYRYYIAVALYETGDFARAKKELAAALPYIEVTPDVARYRTKIEGSM
jgi:hypothetical protein